MEYVKSLCNCFQEALAKFQAAQQALQHTFSRCHLYVIFKKTVSRDEHFCLKAYTFISVISVGALIIFTFLKIMIWYDIYYETFYCFYELTQNSGKSFLIETLLILLKFPISTSSWMRKRRLSYIL